MLHYFQFVLITSASLISFILLNFDPIIDPLLFASSFFHILITDSQLSKENHALPQFFPFESPITWKFSIKHMMLFLIFIIIVDK
jgi:hypothetical protein